MNNKCILCGKKLVKPIFVCRNMPAVSQNFPDADTVKNDRAVDLPLYQCEGCGLLQIDCEPVPYYKESTRAAERCATLVELRRKDYIHLVEKYNMRGKKFLEIGAGKGGYLRTLKEMTEFGIKGYGVEYSSEFVEIARNKEGVEVVQGDPEDENLILEDGPFDVFMSFSYPARLINPNAMMQMARKNLTDDGLGLLSLPSYEHLLEKNGLFDVARDLPAIYSRDSLRYLAMNNGFEVLEEWKEADNYVYAVIRKRKSIDIADYWKESYKVSDELKQFLAENKEKGKKVAVWCAGHYALTVISVSEIGDEIEYIIDKAPFKQNRYAPGSHVLIIGPEYYREKPVDTILILGPIYIDEIVDEIHELCAGKVDIYTMDRNGLRVIEKH